jgi:DNA-binding HxlR family transcriptional regulator
MEPEPKDVIILGAIKSGAKKFDKIRKVTKIDPEEINSILERLEQRGLISVSEKKGLFGKKIEISTTEKGEKELENRIHELEDKWQQMSAIYKSGDKVKLKQYMDENKISFKEMMFFGVLDMMMFSLMFSMIGMSMTSFIPPADIPQDMSDGGDMDGGGDGFDIDIGF